MAVSDASPASPLTTTNALSAVSALAAQSFPTVNDAIDATLELMQRVLGMEVRMVNEITGDQLTFRRLHAPEEFPELEGMVSPLNHNF
jgi:hypothetical protein